MYTIQHMANTAGISNRTLRYYDSIGLLSPTARSEGGYRLYTDNDLLLLQQILIFKRLGLDLKTIKQIVTNPQFDIITSLKNQLRDVAAEQLRLNQLRATIEQTLQQINQGGTISMKDGFKGLKDETIAKNEQTYGTEIRDKYDNEVVEASYDKMRKLSKWEWNRASELASEILSLLPKAMDEGVTSSLAAQLCQKHQEWIQFYWPTYSKDAHLALCEMYTTDERFTAYYDKSRVGAASFLYQAMKHYLQH